jgi:zinc protease
MEARGMLGVGGSPMPGMSLDKLKDAVLAVTDQFLKEGPTQQELDRAKRMIVASEVFARDNQMGMANWYGQMLVAGESLGYIESWDKRIEAVTAEQVLAAMRKRMMGVNHVDGLLLPEAK